MIFKKEMIYVYFKTFVYLKTIKRKKYFPNFIFRI